MTAKKNGVIHPRHRAPPHRPIVAVALRDGERRVRPGRRHHPPRGCESVPDDESLPDRDARGAGSRGGFVPAVPGRDGGGRLAGSEPARCRRRHDGADRHLRHGRGGDREVLPRPRHRHVLRAGLLPEGHVRLRWHRRERAVARHVRRRRRLLRDEAKLGRHGRVRGAVARPGRRAGGGGRGGDRDGDDDVVVVLFRGLAHRLPLPDLREVARPLPLARRCRDRALADGNPPRGGGRVRHVLLRRDRGGGQRLRGRVVPARPRRLPRRAGVLQDRGVQRHRHDTRLVVVVVVVPPRGVRLELLGPADVLLFSHFHPQPVRDPDYGQPDGRHEPEEHVLQRQFLGARRGGLRHPVSEVSMAEQRRGGGSPAGQRMDGAMHVMRPFVSRCRQ